MSMEDPGWGETTPRTVSAPASVPTTVESSLPPGPPPPGPGGRASRPRWVAPLILGAVVVIIGGVVAVALGSGSSKRSSAGPATTTAAGPTAAPAAATATTLPSQADFIARADAICLNFRPQIETATAAGNTQQLAQVGQAELDQIRQLGDPAQGADLIHTMLDQGTQAVNWLLQNDTTDANVSILASDTAAGQFGMRVCNYGH